MLSVSRGRACRLPAEVMSALRYYCNDVVIAMAFGALRPIVLPVILRSMKTAISLPDDLFLSIDARARVLKMSRSSLLARAAREFLERETHTGANATEAWNEAIEQGGQPGDEPAAVAFRRRTKALVRGERGRGR